MLNNRHNILKGLLVAGAVGGTCYLLYPSKDVNDTKECSSGPMIASNLVAGAILGGIAGLLLAPSSGEELRKELSDSYDNIREKTEKLLKDLNKKGHSAASHASENIDEWKKSLQSLLEGLSPSEVKKEASSKFNDFVEWANLGLNVLEKLKSK